MYWNACILSESTNGSNSAGCILFLHNKYDVRRGTCYRCFCEEKDP